MVKVMWATVMAPLLGILAIVVETPFNGSMAVPTKPKFQGLFDHAILLIWWSIPSRAGTQISGTMASLLLEIPIPSSTDWFRFPLTMRRLNLTWSENAAAMTLSSSIVATKWTEATGDDDSHISRMFGPRAPPALGGPISGAEIVLRGAKAQTKATTTSWVLGGTLLEAQTSVGKHHLSKIKLASTSAKLVMFQPTLNQEKVSRINWGPKGLGVKELGV